jgi:hypothetical protein
MRRTLAASALLAVIAQTAGVQPAIAQSPQVQGAPSRTDEFPPDLPARSGPTQQRGGPPPGVRPQLFISPSGEPFREPGDGLAAWIARADTNHDGAVSLEEFRADALRAFKLYDTNGDGRIDGFEIGDYESEIVPEITSLEADSRMAGAGGRGFLGFRKGPAGPPGAGRDGAAGFSLLNEPQPVANADANLDGGVSAQEWMTATNRRFARLDVARTGLLTHDSLRPPPGAKKPQPPK